ncbi:MAG: hypothetical protein ACRBFS_18970 [Aureispira sp.]
MKNVILFFLLGIVLAFSACNEDPCNDKVCGSYSFCEDGDCKCDPGYEINVNGLCVVSNRCVNGVCPPNFVCNNGICVSATGPCANVVCPSGYICQSGICISTAGPCANVTCGQDSVCDNGTCIPTTSSPCVNVTCGQDSVCINGNCIPTTGPCANIICPPNTICDNGNCVADPCANVSCGPYGTCNNGVCDCDPGYEQDANGECTVAWATKFVGTNLPSTEACTAGSSNPGTFSYNTTIGMIDAITLSTQNLAGYGVNNNVDINIISPTDVSLNYTDVAGRRFTGSGSLSGNVLTIDYILYFPTAGTSNDTCQITIIY